LQRLYGITGRKCYEDLLARFQQIGPGECSDTFVATVSIGGAKGLYTIFEAIVMKGENGQLWAAYIDDDVVRHFTTERSYREQPPQTIEKWRSRFADKKLVVENEINVKPNY
jgi:hypothetical protein